MLSYIAVQEGAKAENNTFESHVDFLLEKGVIPVHLKETAHYIRKQGNQAVHRIELKTWKDADLIIYFVGLMLQIIYSVKEKLPQNK